MSKKGVVAVLGIIIIYSIFALSVISAANNTTANLAGFDKSYSCLKDKIDARGYSSMSVEELAFSILALGYDGSRQSALKTELDSRKNSNNYCWPATCTLKETSEVMLAYNHLNANTDGIKNWLMNQTMPAGDLNWYLEIETNNKSICKITYDNSSKTINIAENKQLSGSPGSCLSFSQNNYWLAISSRCYDKEFKISCDNDFLTSTFYKKNSGDVYYITSATQTASPNGETTAKVESLCFKQNGICNYEGSLWASYVLNKKDSSLKSKYLPYLITFSSDSAVQRYLPASFLYSITGFNEYLTSITNLQNSKGYWQLSESNKRYYDTAIALMSFTGSSGSSQVDSAVSYLLDPAVLGDGCWNGGNIRDTSLLLYATSPKAATSATGGTTSQCSDYRDQGYSCTSSTECDRLNGTSLPNFNCFSGLICCSKSKVEQTCSAKGGEICSADEECSGTVESALGTTSCCIDGECKAELPPAQNECSDAGYTCKDACSSDEETSTFECPSEMNAVCCSAKKETTSYWWIWLLIILIILIVLAIIFRNQLSVWLFKIKSKFQKEPVVAQGRPPFPPMQQRPMMPPAGMPRRIIPGQRPMMPRPMARPFPKEQELNDTLKKIRDMGGR